MVRLSEIPNESKISYPPEAALASAAKQPHKDSVQQLHYSGRADPIRSGRRRQEKSLKVFVLSYVLVRHPRLTLLAVSPKRSELLFRLALNSGTAILMGWTDVKTQLRLVATEMLWWKPSAQYFAVSVSEFVQRAAGRTAPIKSNKPVTFSKERAHDHAV